MWIKNNDKERIKSYLKSDIESNITNITDLSNHIHGLISAIDRATAGTPSGKGRDMIDEYQKVLSELSTALQDLYACRNCVEQLDTREWVDDE